MTRFRSHIQHHFNPLHVYCRLRDWGFSYGAARTVSVCYERLVYRVVLA